ncbi:putative phosphoesterase [Palleronia marisminoris]|uniref:Calcineurin-like phosphoesterase n=2 Tax=Palleronia marisminoris TaxID=315423 RepID=A0A1Y5T5N9_9RHOB|nr:putative phosphoesterase [Palleronia marisminoris]SLN54606.1 Calcineurin-like phosphoesterase [Palleronia marisminoris]
MPIERNMNFCDFQLSGETLRILSTGALWWPAEATLVVSDLHLCKSERVARRSGQMLPPYETRDTLARLDSDVLATKPARVICLGDSFDDDAAREGLGDAETLWISRMQAGREWVWIAGNHDPAPVDLGGTAKSELLAGPLTFRHIATPEQGEISGHYHPKARLALGGKMVSRPCCLHDGRHAILPAYGTYTGGLDWTSPALASLLAPGACAILTGRQPCAVPVPQRARA